MADSPFRIPVSGRHTADIVATTPDGTGPRDALDNLADALDQIAESWQTFRADAARIIGRAWDQFHGLA